MITFCSTRNKESVLAQEAMESQFGNKCEAGDDLEETAEPVPPLEDIIVGAKGLALEKMPEYELLEGTSATITTQDLPSSTDARTTPSSSKVGIHDPRVRTC